LLLPPDVAPAVELELLVGPLEPELDEEDEEEDEEESSSSERFPLMPFRVSTVADVRLRNE
jgi:hypothetical protein